MTQSTNSTKYPRLELVHRKMCEQFPNARCFFNTGECYTDFSGCRMGRREFKRIASKATPVKPVMVWSMA